MGFEPTTHALRMRCSTGLSYLGILSKQAKRRFSGAQANLLPARLFNATAEGTGNPTV